MNRIPLFDPQAEYRALTERIRESIADVLDKGVYVGGTEVRNFENEIARLVQTRYAVSTANGTDSLILALMACGVGTGDEVITSPFTFFATAEAIVRVGATPVFADIDERTYNLSPSKVEAKVTNRTKAIIPVHIFGQPADMDAFSELAARYSLYIIEDACQAIGATYKGKPVGSLGHAACISFYPTKNLGGYGDGGMVTTNDEAIAERIRVLAFHGMGKRKYYHEAVGFNSRLDEIQAVMLRIKMQKLAAWNGRRQQLAEQYTNQLSHLGNLTLPYCDADIGHVYHLYVVQNADPARLMLHLEQKGISAARYYPCPLHLQQAMNSLGYKEGDLPVSERVARRALALPVHPFITDEQQQYVIEQLVKYNQNDKGADDL
ncbi:dTDP-4-amino-4,6-dideoxygalactose transaminase [Paenibacillus taihuensis]|uniref:dTDP-4-amino-4,6-dideoxygalactose transaminase n=1 Tax=Paenibacillus taihuensis TaxID=1156355 RepID=A0A3D9SIP3_9BACL|nr:DegT/DnrJ/EryC1/StrS family aminotransferase [Paenibacillus taihuensis]REE93150.1 dTDP-4-amino-4,6-dideoxygalactose transaminase [Paenibacillus taihuensis]